MSRKISGIIYVVISILLLLYFESAIFKLFSVLGITISKYKPLVITLIKLGIKVLLAIIVYLIYKKEFRHSRTNKNIFKSILIILVGLISLTLIMYLFKFVVKYLGDIFNVKVLSNSFYNIFNKTLTLNLVLKIISDYILYPYIYVSLIILSIDKLTNRTDILLILSGLFASIIYALSLKGTVTFVIINSLSTFVMFLILAFIYKKDKRIISSIVIYSLYLLTSGLFINYLGW